MEEEEDDLSCPICFLTIPHWNCTKTDCKHTFHETCIYEWYNKLQRMECPYCHQSTYPNIEFLRKLDGIIIKLGMCGVTVWKSTVLREQLEAIKHRRWPITESVFRFIEGYNEEEAHLFITQSLESLVSRGYFEKKGESTYVYI